MGPVQMDVVTSFHTEGHVFIVVCPFNLYIYFVELRTGPLLCRIHNKALPQNKPTTHKQIKMVRDN